MTMILWCKKSRSCLATAEKVDGLCLAMGLMLWSTVTRPQFCKHCLSMTCGRNKCLSRALIWPSKITTSSSAALLVLAAASISQWLRVGSLRPWNAQSATAPWRNSPLSFAAMMRSYQTSSPNKWSAATLPWSSLVPLNNICWVRSFFSFQF